MAIRKALIVLRVLATTSATIEDLMDAASVSRPTLYRLLSDCERELQMRIKCVEGAYRVSNWGLVNRRRLVDTWPEAGLS